MNMKITARCWCGACEPPSDGALVMDSRPRGGSSGDHRASGRGIEVGPEDPALTQVTQGGFRHND